MEYERIHKVQSTHIRRMENEVEMNDCNERASPTSLLQWSQWQLIDSLLPTGGFAHSFGLEAAIQARLVSQPEDLRMFVIHVLENTGSLLLPFVHATTISPNIQTWHKLDGILNATLTNEVGRKASISQGSALIRVSASVFSEVPSLKAMRDLSLRSGEVFFHHAPIFGLICGLLGLDSENSQRAYMFITMRDIISAATRLNLVGPLGGAVLQHQVAVVAEDLLKKWMNRAVEDACQTSPLLDTVQHFRCGDYIVKEPMVIGHECAGIIEEVGSQVKTLVPGDRVALEPGISCSICSPCKEGQYNLCPDMKFFATPPIHGALANHMVHPAHLCFKLPESVSLEEGAMCEPLSVGVHACRRANVGPQSHVLVIGAGPIGLVSMLAARAYGASRIVIVDVDGKRLSVAKELGADEIVKVTTNIQDVDAEVQRIKEAMKSGVDVTFDCAGFSKTMSTSLKATRAGGKVCLVGMGHHEMTVPLTPAAAREVDVVGIYRYKNTWPTCLEFIRSGKIDVKPLITHRFGFTQKDVEEAFATSAGGDNAIKVMFNL